MSKDRFNFRFYDKEDNVMIYPENNVFIGRCFRLDLGDMLLRDRFIPMQYIGINDKNGKPVCEGDILEDKYGALHAISWNEKGFYESDTFAVAGFYKTIQEDMEILGNIYENKKLLKLIERTN